MKHLYLSFTLLLLICHSFAQHSANKNQFSKSELIRISGGFDGGFRNNTSSVVHQGTLYQAPKETDARTATGRVDVQATIFKLFSLGVHYRGGALYDEEEVSGVKNLNHSIHVLGGNLRVFPIYLERFNWYLGGTGGYAWLERNTQLSNNDHSTYRARYSSPNIEVETGAHWYFTKHFSINLGFNYSWQNFIMTDFYIDAEQQDLEGWESKINSKGFRINLGITYRFSAHKPNSCDTCPLH